MSNFESGKVPDWALKLYETTLELYNLQDAFEELKEDFVDYVCSGVQNPYPYCKNKQPDCDDGRGWCSYRHCNGFNPTTYRTKVDERPQDIDS